MIHLKPVSCQNAQTYKQTRLRALEDTPTAFGSTYAQESKLSENEWLKRIQHWTSDHAIAYLAIDEKKPCGLIGTYIHKDDPTRAGIVSMWVAPEKRGQKIGRQLVEAACGWARTKNAHHVYLMVTSNNETAIAFYKRLGFEQTGYTEPYPNDDRLIEYEMARNLA